MPAPVAPRLHGEPVTKSTRRPSRHEAQPATAIGNVNGAPTARIASSDGSPSTLGSPTAGDRGSGAAPALPHRHSKHHIAAVDSLDSTTATAASPGSSPFRVSLKFILICGAIFIAMVSGAIAFAPLYTEASSSSLRAAKSFSEEVAEATALAMKNFVASPVFNVMALQRDIDLGAIDVYDNQSVATWLSALVRDTGSDQLFILYLENDFGYLAGRVNTLNISLPPKENETIFSAYSSVTGVVDFWYLPDHNPNLSATPPISQRTPFNHKLRPYYSVFKGSTSRSWVAPFVDVTKLFVDVGVGGPIYQPSSGSAIVGIVGVFYQTVTIQSYMASLTIGKSGQALVYDAATHAFLGGTGDSPGTVIVHANGSATTRPVTTLTEPELFRVVLSQLPLVSSPSLSSSSNSRSGNNAAQTTVVDGKCFVSVKSVSDVYGLELRVVVIVPTLDYTSDISYAMTVGLASGSAAVGALIILSAVCLHLLLRPLQQLERKLYESASLVAMNVADMPPLDSVISELSTIDKAYRTLVDELQTVRSFLPQSVLRQLDEDRRRRAAAAQNNTTSTAIEGGSGYGSPLDEYHVDPQLLGNSGGGGVGGSSAARRRSIPSSVSSPTAHSDTQEFGVGAVPSSGDDGLPRPSLLVSPGASAGRRVSGSTAGGGGSDPSQTQQQQQPQPQHQPVFSNMARVDAPLTPRKVTLVCVNLCGFHRALKQLGPVALHQMHANVVRTVLHNVNRRCGVVDSVHGDRFLVSFNASVPAMNPAECACETVLVLRQALSSSSELPGCMGARYGVATGEALCGNFGPDEMKRFSVIGPVVNQAYALMLQTKIESVLNLTNVETFNDATKHFVLQHVGFVMLPQSTQGSLISTLLQRRAPSDSVGSTPAFARLTISDNEKQQQQQQQQPIVPVAIIDKVNEAFDCFSAGNVTRTRELLRTIPREYSGWLLKALQSVSDTM